VVFNGEIYNYQELRAGSDPPGHRFKTNSDTETLMHLYEAGRAPMGISKLRGMFAFCIWDAKRDRRSAAGARPLRQEAALLCGPARKACSSAAN
jgi:asparagine synthase (glutamine-hydrolysing)